MAKKRSDEIPLTAHSDDMVRKERERKKLPLVQVLRGEGKWRPSTSGRLNNQFNVLIRSLKHPSTCVSRAERWEELFSSSRYRDETRENSFTSQRLSRVRDFADESAITRNEAKRRTTQAVRSQWMMGGCYRLPGR